MPEKLPLYGLNVYYVVHICDFGMLRVNGRFTWVSIAMKSITLGGGGGGGGRVIKPCMSKMLHVQESQMAALNTVMNGIAFFLPCHNGSFFSD